MCPLMITQVVPNRFPRYLPTASTCLSYIDYFHTVLLELVSVPGAVRLLGGGLMAPKGIRR